MLRDGSEGSEVAEMGRPQDLLADPSSLCAGLLVAPQCYCAAHACALSDSARLCLKAKRNNKSMGRMLGQFL